MRKEWGKEDKMIFKILAVLLLLFFSWVSSAFACTGFAVYGNQIIYGMNFDYFSIPLKFLIESGSGMRTFHLAFLYDQTVNKPEVKNYFAKTCGINDKGLFCSCQEIEPYTEGTGELRDNEMHIGDHYDAVAAFPDVEQVKSHINEKRWKQSTGPSLHNLFADMKGAAIVSETDNKTNFISEIKDDFMVMSNFANYALNGKDYKEAIGVGADRYITASEYIMGNIASFSVDKGFDLLKKVAMHDSDCATLCSMIFLAQENQIYIALNRNYSKLWKVSLDPGIVETYRGHRKPARVHIGSEGLPSTELEALGS